MLHQGCDATLPPPEMHTYGVGLLKTALAQSSRPATQGGCLFCASRSTRRSIARKREPCSSTCKIGNMLLIKTIVDLSQPLPTAQFRFFQNLVPFHRILPSRSRTSIARARVRDLPVGEMGPSLQLNITEFIGSGLVCSERR